MPRATPGGAVATARAAETAGARAERAEGDADRSAPGRRKLAVHRRISPPHARWRWRRVWFTLP
jgi:hypothetical protein